MMQSSTRVAAATAMSFVFAVVLVGADQVRRSSPRSSSVTLEVSLKVGAGAYTGKGPGSCTHAPKGSIYGVLSEMWTVRHQEEGRSMQLTLWKPADGSAPMFNLSVSGKTNASISTVRGGQVTGSGTVTLAPSGKGGTFTIDAKGKTGEAISGTLKCEAFTPAIAEGGN